MEDTILVSPVLEPPAPRRGGALVLASLTVDLVRASYRSETFPQDWTDSQRERGEERYVKWLQLKVLHAGARLAPTRDIDLFWHLHMLSPVAYHRDCLRLFGRLMDHDGGFGNDPTELPELKRVFCETAALWEATYQEPYRDDGVWMNGDEEATKCWHSCAGRCWHACASK